MIPLLEYLYILFQSTSYTSELITAKKIYLYMYIMILKKLIHYKKKENNEHIYCF